MHSRRSRKRGDSGAYEASGSLRSDVDNFIQAWDCREGRSLAMDGSMILCSFLAFALYINTFTAEFAYDDSRAILKNQDLLPETPLSHVFYNDFWGTPLRHSGSHKSYRPLCVLTFRLNHLMDGLRPRGYHIGNVLLHAAVTGLFTHTAKVLTGRSSVATAAGLLFASHPIHTEAVAGIVGRADILACLFFLLAFLGYLKYCKWRDLVAVGGVAAWKWTWLLWTAVCAVAALLCKEQGVTVLVVCAIYDVFIHSRLRLVDLPQVFHGKYRGVLEGLVSLSVMAAAFVGFRVYFMGSEVPEFAPADNPAADSDIFLTRTLTFFYLPVCNLWLLAYPRMLSFDWSMDAIPLIESLGDVRNVWTLSFGAGLTYIAWLVLGVNCNERKPKKPTSNGYANHCTANTISANSSATTTKGNTHRRFVRCASVSSTDSNDSTRYLQHRTSLASLHIIIISLALLVFPFVPALNLFFYVGFVIAERVLYIPSMGYCLLLAHGVYILLRTRCDRAVARKALVGAFVCLILVYSVRTVVRNYDWRSEENLYKAGIKVNPAKAWGNLGNILNSNGRSSEAEQAYRAALQYRANMADVHYNLGILLQEQKRYEEAIESYTLALQCRPRLSMAYLNLGIIYAATEKKEEAEKMYRHCSAIDITGLKDPKLHEQTKISALYNLGRLLADQDKYREAIEVYEEAVAKRPSHYAPQSLYNMLGEGYSKLGQLETAEHWYRESLAVKPDHVPAFLTMGKLCQKRGEIQPAMDWFLKAKSMAPKDASVYQHYGQFLGDLGRHQEAADSYVQAAKWAPDDFELIFNTANALRQAERNKDAEHYYKEAAKLRPKVATAHMNLGAILHYNGKLQDAERSYLAALALKPDDSVTQNNLQKLRNLMQKTHGGGGAS